jgi:hypothetical protein
MRLVSRAGKRCPSKDQKYLASVQGTEERFKRSDAVSMLLIIRKGRQMKSGNNTE